MQSTIYPILIPGIVAILSLLLGAFLGRRKNSAEIENLEIDGETNIGEAWAKYAAQMKKDKDELRQEFNLQFQKMTELHTKEIETLKQEFDLKLKQKEEEGKIKDERITALEKQVGDMQIEIDKYKNLDLSIDHAASNIHSTIDAAAQNMKEVIHSGEDTSITKS